VSATARIVVRRPPGGARDLLRKYWIEVDGTRVGTLSRGDTAEFPVVPGTHRVRATIDWTGSAPLRVEVGVGEEVHLRVEPGGTVFRADQLFRRTGYLRLSPEEPTDGRVARVQQADIPWPPLIGWIALPLGFLGIFLTSYGVHGLIQRDRPYSLAATVAGVLLFVVPLLLARRARHHRRGAA